MRLVPRKIKQWRISSDKLLWMSDRHLNEITWKSLFLENKTKSDIFILMQIQKQHYQIQGKKITFRPYCRKYVKEYHEWFIKDPELLYLTGSEPLSL